MEAHNGALMPSALEIDTAAMRDRERCPLCGSMLTFKGFASTGQRVLGCQAAITHYQQDRPATMVPCDMEEKRFFISGRQVPIVAWWPKQRYRD